MAIPIPSNFDVTFNRSFYKKIDDNVSRRITRAISKSRGIIKSKISSLFNQYLLNNSIVKSLYGHGGDPSLKGHFGFYSDSIVDDALEELLEIVTDNIVVQTKRRTSTEALITVPVVVTGFSLEDLGNVDQSLDYDSHPFSYVSSSSGEKIRWMYYIMRPSVDVIESDIESIRDWAIKTKGLTIKQMNNSRSGEAIMVSAESASKKDLKSLSFPYKTPRDIFPSDGSVNFIEQIYRNRNFRKQLTDIVSNTIVGNLRNV